MCVPPCCHHQLRLLACRHRTNQTEVWHLRKSFRGCGPGQQETLLISFLFLRREKRCLRYRPRQVVLIKAGYPMLPCPLSTEMSHWESAASKWEGSGAEWRLAVGSSQIQGIVWPVRPVTWILKPPQRVDFWSVRKAGTTCSSKRRHVVLCWGINLCLQVRGCL